MTKQETIEKSIRYRGVFLHHVSILEAYLNLYIANYFIGKESPDKMAELQVVILSDERFSFSSSIQVFKYISETHDLEWYTSYTSLRKLSSKTPHTLNSDLMHIMENRNVFAHRILENYDVDIFKKPKENDTIRFVKFKNRIEPTDFTEDGFTLFVRMISYISMFIIERCKN